jgi:predicted permease
MDGRLLLVSTIVALACAVLCGLAPALQSTRADLVTGLKTGLTDSVGRKRFWGRNLLVVAQVATCMMLLTASFLLARSFRNTTVGGLGYPTDHLLMVRLDPRLVQYDAAQTQHFYEQLLARVRQAPGVRSAGLTQNPPLSLGKFDVLSFVPDAFDMPTDREAFTAPMDAIDEGFFNTMGLPIVSGRGFLATDAADQPRVAVVNEQFVKRYWPGGNGVGKRLWLDRRNGTSVEIVGVTKTVKYRATGEKPTEFVYLPLPQHREARMLLLVRTSADPLEMVAPVRDIVRALEPNLPLLETRTYDDLYRYHVVEGPGVAIQMSVLMGVVALLLAMVGLYGLVAYNVSRRTREIGIRMALGAGPAMAFRLVMRQGLVLVGLGSALGMMMAFGIERLIKAAIFNVGGVDLLVYLVVVPLVVLVTLLAAYGPARRASRIAPTLALRSD